MNPTTNQLLVQFRQHDLQVEAAQGRLAANAKPDKVSPTSPVAATRRFVAGLAVLAAALVH